MSQPDVPSAIAFLLAVGILILLLSTGVLHG
jgi:hypothetical protein